MDLSNVKRCKVLKGQPYTPTGPSWNPRLKERCEKVADKVFSGYDYTVHYIPPVDHKFTKPIGDHQCRVDFTDSAVQASLLLDVDCEERCWEAKEYLGIDKTEEECVAECKEEIMAFSRSSVRFNPRSESVEESSVAQPYWALHQDEDSWYDSGGMSIDERVAMRFLPIDCEAMDVGWHHVHDFMGNPEEEREPDVMFIHVRAIKPGRCKVGAVMKEIKEPRPYEQQRLGQFHPETFSSWYARFNKKKDRIRPEAHRMMMKDAIFQDMIGAIEKKLTYGRKMRDPEAFRRYFLDEDVETLGKWEMWTAPSGRDTRFNKPYLEETLDFWSDPDNIARAKILLSKIEDQVTGRTRYGIRSGVATEPGHILAWSNGCMCWVVFQKKHQPGEELYLDSNYIYVPGDYETLERIRWMIPDLPLVHMDWTKTMDLTFKEQKERERFR